MRSKSNGIKDHSCRKHSLRQAINEKCKECIYDPLAAGNWRVQVTLCSCHSCPLFAVRPKTRGAIGDGVFDYYRVPLSERAALLQKEPQMAHFQGKRDSGRVRVGGKGSGRNAAYSRAFQERLSEGGSKS